MNVKLIIDTPTGERRIRFSSVQSALDAAAEELKESLKPENRLDVPKLMNKLIWGDKSEFYDAHRKSLEDQSGVNE